MGYMSGMPSWVRKQIREKRNQGTTHVPAQTQPYTYDTLGRKVWKETGEKYVKGTEATEGYTESGRKWNQKTESWDENKYSWIDDDRVPSQAEIDFYGAQDAGKDPVITQDHLDEIGQGEGGEGHLAENLVKTPEEIAEDNAPENQPVEPQYDNPEDDPLWTHTDTTQWTAENQPTEEELSGDSLGTDTTPNALAGGSLMTGGKSGSSSVGGGYGKTRKKEISRGQMNLTQGRNRSLLTGV